MATGGKNDDVWSADQSAEEEEETSLAGVGHPEIFCNRAGRYQPLTGRSSAFELIDLKQFLSDTS